VSDDSGVSITAELEEYLHEHIPISAAMGVEVVSISDAEVRLRAPLAPNINHRNTVFGGSAAAVGILAGWALLHVLLGHGGQVSRIVIQRGTTEYEHPIHGDFDAIARAPSEAAWDRFTNMLERRGLGRIELEVELSTDGVSVGWCRGTYVVLPLSSEEPDDEGGLGT
jgi:thioesterase domain-containing protein